MLFISRNQNEMVFFQGYIVEDFAETLGLELVTLYLVLDEEVKQKKNIFPMRLIAGITGIQILM